MINDSKMLIDKALQGEVYNLPPTHRIIRRTGKLTVIDSGADNVVLEMELYSKQVAKISKIYLKKYLLMNLLSKEKRFGAKPESLQTDLRYERDRLGLLELYFPKGCLAHQYKMARKIPIPRAVVKELLGEEGKWNEKLFEGDSLMCWTLVTIQEKVSLHQSTDSISLCVRYAEKKNMEQINKQKYLEVTDAAVFGNDELPVPLNDFLAVHDAPQLKAFFEKMTRMSSSGKNQIADFIRRTIQFANEKREVIDIIGDRNIVFIPTQEGKEEWSYKIIDPFPLVPNSLSTTLTVLKRLSNDGRIQTQDEGLAVFTCLNFIRSVNQLAAVLGLEARVTTLFSLPGVSAGLIFNAINTF